MTTTELYETSSSLQKLPRRTALSQHSLRCIVKHVIPTRQREYVEGTVFTVLASLRTGERVGVNESEVRLHFHDEWATAASFVECGDIVILNGFVLIDVPQYDLKSGTSINPLIVHPLEEESTLRVIQKAPYGDTIEVAVAPDCFDNPRVRVLTAG